MVEQRKVDMKRVMEDVVQKDNVDALAEILATNVVLHTVGGPDIEGLEAYKQVSRDLSSAFPDLQFTIDEILVEGDKTASRYTLQGTHTGESPAVPVPPTGKRVTWGGCAMAHWDGGKIVEAWMYADNLGMMQQLGVIPTPE